MSTDDQRSKYVSNVSTESAVQLADFVESIDSENGQYHSSQEVINQIEHFLDKPFNITSLVQIQSYCATTNDHTALTALNENLKTLIQFANVIPQLNNAVRPLIVELISSHSMKVFYRCFNNEHPSITIPAVNLLTAIVSFDNGIFVDQFLENFDLSLRSLADLLYPTKLSVRLSSQGKSHTTVRHYMSLFWIALCSHASPLTRIDLLTNNKKINHNWIKFITEFDNANLIKKVFNFIDEKILCEPALRKMTKCKVLGDFTLAKLVELYKNEDVREDVHALLTKMTTDEGNGLLFHDYRTWFKNVPLDCLPSNTTFNNAGVSISIGETTFKINNKIIYNVLTTLHPWADSMQLKLALNILSKVPELVAPYTTHLFHTNGAHDPKLTSFYIGQTLLLTKIVQLSIPEDFTKMLKNLVNNVADGPYSSMKPEFYLSSKILMEVICPASLNRSSLTKGLNAANQITRHLTAQLVISITQKFSRVDKLLGFNENSLFTTLRNELQDIIASLKLPDPSVLVGVTNECLKANDINKLLLLNYMKAAECFHKTLDIDVHLQLGSFNSLIGLNDATTSNSLLAQGKLSDVDLLLFNSYLVVTTQSSQSSQQSKWWNVTPGSQNSLFTTIAKLPYDLQYREEDNKATQADNALIGKSVEVLSNFLDDSIAFEDYKSPASNVLSSQAWAIVLSLLNCFNLLIESKTEIIDSICKTLDESISRSVRTPYKYFDVVTEHVNKVGMKHARLSSFFAALCEQSKFAKPEHLQFVNQWIKVLGVYMFILGEPLAVMNSVTNEYCGFALEFDTHTYESYLKSKNNLKAVGFSNFSNICFTPWDKLGSKANTLIPKTDIEIVAMLNRVETLVDSNLELKNIEETILDLISLYGNYMVQKYTNYIDNGVSVNDVNLLERKFWKMLLVSAADYNNQTSKSKFLKKCFVMDLSSEIFRSLWNSNSLDYEFKKSLQELIFDLINDRNLPSTAVEHMAQYLWVLSDKQVLKLIVDTPFNDLSSALLDAAIKRNQKLESEEVMRYCKEKSNSCIISPEFSQNFSKLSINSIFTNDQISELAGLAKSTQNQELIYDILKSASDSNLEIRKFIGEQLQSEFITISKSIEGFKFLQFISVGYSAFRSKLYEISSDHVNSILSKKIEANKDLKVYLYSMTLQLNENSDNQMEIERQINQLIQLDSVRNVADLIFSPQMTTLIFLLFGKEKSYILKEWLTRATLYITKVFAETAERHLDEEFEDFLKCLQKSLNFPVWKFVSKNMLNSQLEVILSKPWITNLKILKYSAWVIISGSKNVIECTKLVNILLNNPNNSLGLDANSITVGDFEEIKYYTSLILSFLFKMNVNQLSRFELLFKIARLYRGTTRPCDLVLKDLLMAIEEVSGESWIQLVSNWDLVDEWLPADSNGDHAAADAIITKAPDMIIETPGLHDCLTVTLHKAIVEATVKNFDPSIRSIRLPELENTIHTHAQDFAKLQKFYQYKKVDEEDIEHRVVYDCEFILLLIVNNEDLFKFSGDSVTVNIRALISTWLLQLTICGLAHEVNDLQEISKRIISSVILTVEEDIKTLESKRDKKNEKTEISTEVAGAAISTFKERSAFKVYLCNLLYTFEEKKLAIQAGEEREPMPKLFIVFLSYLVPVLANPAHFLYEKAYRYILGGSKYRDYEIPMYKSIMVNFTKDEHTQSHNDDADYYKQLQWTLRILGKSITSPEDLKIIRRNDVIEQLSNLLNSSYINNKIQENILEVFERIIRLQNGADLLVRSFGLLSFVESKKVTTVRSKKLWDKFAKTAMKAMVGSECNGKDKRAREWCADDFGNVVKRLCE